MIDSLEKAKMVIEALHADINRLEMTTSRMDDRSTEGRLLQSPIFSAGPSFLDVNSQVRQRLGLHLKTAAAISLTSNRSRSNVRIRSRSVSEEYYGQNYLWSRHKSLSDIWHHSTDTDEPPLCRKLRPTATSSKNMASVNWTSCVRTSFTIIVLTLMTLMAGMTIHMLLTVRDFDRKLLTTSDAQNASMHYPTSHSPSLVDEVDKHLCDPNSSMDIELLAVSLKSRVFGQDLAIDTLLSRLTDHFSWNASGQMVSLPSSFTYPTVLVLHGGTGTGKTHAVRILSEHFTRAGIKVDWYFPTLDRPSKKLVEWVATRWGSGLSTACTVVFVFDDYDVISDLDQLERVISYSKTLLGNQSGASLNRLIFLVTFSEGSEFLETELLEHLMNDGVREDFVTDVAQWQCPLGEQQVTYVPFLPIQSQQLEECLRDALTFEKVNQETAVSLAIEKTIFVPESFPVFSKTGCKRLQIQL